MTDRTEQLAALHRGNLIGAAERLLAAGERATMDDVCREAGYAKSTVYRYFSGKEEIEAHIALRAMAALQELLTRALSAGTFREKYDAATAALTSFYIDNPLYFEKAVGAIDIDFEGKPPVYRAVYEKGEAINRALFATFTEAAAAGEIRSVDPSVAVMTLWSALTGVIRLAFVKEAYVTLAAGGREAFLTGAFDLLYRTVAK